MLKGADGPASASPAIKSTELIQSRRFCPRFAVRPFPSYRPHTEALGSSAQIRCVYPSCWRYRVASKSASKVAKITQMLRRIVRNLWRRGIGSCLSQLKRELSPWLGCRIYWAWAIISLAGIGGISLSPRWLFQERRLSLALRLTFAVQRSCELEHLATTSQPSFVCLLLSKAHKVSPARAPSVSMTVSKKPLRSSAEQALASAAHMPTKDMLTASSVNNLFSRVPSLSATGTFRPGRMSSAGGSIRPSDSAALRGPGSLNPSRPRGTGRGSGPGRDRSDANQWANAIGWDVLTRADTAAGSGVSTRTDTAGG